MKIIESINGTFKREELSAYEFIDYFDNDIYCHHLHGDAFWYKENKLHRDNDMPAIEWLNGDKSWYKNGFLFRENGKHTKEYGGDKVWFNKDGEIHNENGPAVIDKSGVCQYWLYGVKIEENLYLLNKNLNEELINKNVVLGKNKI